MSRKLRFEAVKELEFYAMPRVVSVVSFLSIYNFTYIYFLYKDNTYKHDQAQNWKKKQNIIYSLQNILVFAGIEFFGRPFKPRNRRKLVTLNYYRFVIYIYLAMDFLQHCICVTSIRIVMKWNDTNLLINRCIYHTFLNLKTKCKLPLS